LFAAWSETKVEGSAVARDLKGLSTETLAAYRKIQHGWLAIKLICVGLFSAAFVLGGVSQQVLAIIFIAAAFIFSAIAIPRQYVTERKLARRAVAEMRRGGNDSV
jgi:hypothetical protein